MSRLDAGEEEHAGAPACDGPRALLLSARKVPLGGVRAMSVHRSLPQRDLPMVGAWCFLDRFGPQRTRMRVDPHPHMGLQTVTWPFVGEVRHRDTVGSDVVVRRGVLNLMTAGEGIAHSEYSVGDEPVDLDALQLWVALPEQARHGRPSFERHADLPSLPLRDEDGRVTGSATVVLGDLAGVRSPATAHTPIVGAELAMTAASRTALALRPDWEYALVGISGSVAVEHGPNGDATTLAPEQLLYLGTGRDSVTISAEKDAVLFLLGGEPFGDEIVMWWNFVGRTHDEIVSARQAWEAGSDRFGQVVGHGDERIPAPPMPAVRLTPRRRRL